VAQFDASASKFDLEHLRGARNEVIFLDQFYVF